VKKGLVAEMKCLQVGTHVSGPTEIEMAPTIKEQVTRRWREFGI